MNGYQQQGEPLLFVGGGLTKTTLLSFTAGRLFAYLFFNYRPGEMKSGKNLVSGLHVAIEKDMGPSRAARVRRTASHVSTMGTYPV